MLWCQISIVGTPQVDTYTARDLCCGVSVPRLFNKPTISLAALYLPLIPPLRPLREAVGQACRGGLTGRPHAVKEEPDVLRHAT